MKNPAHDYIQPIEIHKLEYFHKLKNNYKLYNLIQNTLRKFSLNNEEHNIIRALELLGPLLQTKNVIRMLAKPLTTSDTIRINFQKRFFEEKNPV